MSPADPVHSDGAPLAQQGGWEQWGAGLCCWHRPGALRAVQGPTGSQALVQLVHHPNFPASAASGCTQGWMSWFQPLQLKKGRGRNASQLCLLQAGRQAEHRLLVLSGGMYQTQTLFCYRWGKASTNNQMSFPIFCVSLCDADRGTPNVSKQAVPICSRQTIS